MIQRSPDERRLYQARLKAERDAISNRDSAINEGIEIGVQKEKLQGAKKLVQTLQGLLGVAVASDQDLANKTLEELERMSADLQDKLRKR